MFCTACGHGKLPEGAKFCPACGHKQPSAEKPVQDAPATRPGAKVVISQSVAHAEGGEQIGLKAGTITGNVHIDQKNVFEIYNPSPEVLEKLSALKQVSTELTPGGSDAGGALGSTERLVSLEKHVGEILAHVRKAEAGNQKVTAIDVQGERLSRVDLLVKQAILLKAEAGQMYLDKLAEHKADIETARSAQPGPTFQLDLAGFLEGFDSDAHQGKLDEADALLAEAQELDPTNAEILLHRAQVGSDRGDDPEKISAHLFKVVHLLDPPDNDRDRFHLAQAKFLQAVTGEHLHPGLLRDARALFVGLGRNDWVEQCDLNLASGGGTVSAPENAFNFSGSWFVQVSDGSSFNLLLLPNGTLGGSKPMGWLNVPNPLNGQWAADPASNSLVMQGTIGFEQPFFLQLALQATEGSQMRFAGSDGLAYEFTAAG